MVITKVFIFCAVMSVAMSFTLPDQSAGFPLPEIDLLKGSEQLTRSVRSPDDESRRRVQVYAEHHDTHGTSANVKYTHPLSDNMDVYASASRNFKYNDNSGHVGLEYRF